MNKAVHYKLNKHFLWNWQWQRLKSLSSRFNWHWEWKASVGTDWILWSFQLCSPSLRFDSIIHGSGGKIIWTWRNNSFSASFSTSIACTGLFSGSDARLTLTCKLDWKLIQAVFSRTDDQRAIQFICQSLSSQFTDVFKWRGFEVKLNLKDLSGKKSEDRQLQF